MRVALFGPERPTGQNFLAVQEEGWYQSWSLLRKISNHLCFRTIVFKFIHCLPTLLFSHLILRGNSAMISQHYILYQLYCMACNRILCSVYQNFPVKRNGKIWGFRKLSLMHTHTHTHTHTHPQLFKTVFAGVSVKSQLNLNVEQ